MPPGAAAGDYYGYAAASGSSGSVLVFGLLRYATLSSSGTIVSGSAVTYEEAVKQCVAASGGGGGAPASTVCDKLKAADGGGKAAIFFFSFSMLFMLISAISMSVNAHNKLGRTVANQVLKVLGSPLMSLVFLGLALATHVIACACGWGTIGALAEYSRNPTGSNNVISIMVALPGAGLAGWSLFLLFLSLILELSSRSCCKDWKPPAGAGAHASGGTTVIVTSPMQYAPQAALPPPPQAGGWLRQTDGKDTWFFNPTSKETVWQLPPGAVVVG